MTVVPAPRPVWELLAGQVNQRRYEALRAYLFQGASLQQAADATGYTPRRACVAGPGLAGGPAHGVRAAGNTRAQERPEERRCPRPGHRTAP